MKRTIILLCISAFCAVIYAQENNFIGEWEGSIPGYDFNIRFMHSNTCTITVKTVQDGRVITEEANGTYSYDDDIIRINGNFPGSRGIHGLRIHGLSQMINWTSVYAFNNNDNTAFFMMITPPGVNTRTRISFARVIKWDSSED